MQLLISEILDQVEAASDLNQKINILRQNDSHIIRTIMRLNYDPYLKMDLPEGEPPFKKILERPAGYSESNLNTEYRRFYIWLTPQPTLPKLKKEALFVTMLESLHWSEAEVLLSAKDRKLHKKYKSLTEDMIRQAYPNTITPREKFPEDFDAPLV